MLRGFILPLLLLAALCGQSLAFPGFTGWQGFPSWSSSTQGFKTSFDATAPAALSPAPTVTGGAASLSPTLGSELVTNGGFETAGAGGADVFGSWSESVGSGVIVDETTLVHGGGHAAKLVDGATTTDALYQNLPAGALAAGTLNFVEFYSRGDGTNSGDFSFYDAALTTFIIGRKSTGVTGTSYVATKAYFHIPPTLTSTIKRIYLYPKNTTGAIAYFDDVSVKQVTLATTFSTARVPQARKTRAPVTALNGEWAGVAMCLDSRTAPLNYVVAFIDHGASNYLKMYSVTNGAWSAALVNANPTYGAGKYIQLRKSGNVFSAWYGSDPNSMVQIGDSATVAGMTGNFHGLFATGSTSTFGSLEVLK